MNPSGLFALPVICAEVPAEITVTRNAENYAQLAAVLLEEGLLQESDWQGDLSASVRTGLRRFVSEDCGAWQGGGFIPLEFVYTDHVRHADLGGYGDGLDPDNDDEQDEDDFYYGGDPTGGSLGDNPGGGFGLAVHEFRECFLGAGITALEKVHPGAGYSILSTLEDALHPTCGCIGPANARYMIELWGAGADQGEKPAATLKRFHDTVPLEAVPEETGGFSREAVEQARDAQRDAEDGRWWKALELTLSLRGLLDAAREQKIERDMTEECHVFGYPLDSVVPVMLRWSDKDMISRIFDDYHENLHNQEAHTHVAFFKGFDPRKAESLRRAAQHIKIVLKIIVTADRILSLLHTPPGLEARLAALDRQTMHCNAYGVGY